MGKCFEMICLKYVYRIPLNETPTSAHNMTLKDGQQHAERFNLAVFND